MIEYQNLPKEQHMVYRMQNKIFTRNRSPRKLQLKNKKNTFPESHNNRETIIFCRKPHTNQTDDSKYFSLTCFTVEAITIRKSEILYVN